MVARNIGERLNKNGFLANVIVFFDVSFLVSWILGKEGNRINWQEIDSPILSLRHLWSNICHMIPLQMLSLMYPLPVSITFNTDMNLHGTQQFP